MQNVSLRESDGQIAVGMGWIVRLQLDGRAIECEFAICTEDLARNRACRQGQEIVVPIFNALDLREMLAGVLVANNLRADRMKPLVSTGAIKVPMRVDQVCDGLGAQTGEGFSELRARHANAAIDRHLSVGTGQDGNIATGAFKHAQISAELVRSHRRRRRTVFDESHYPAGFCKSLPRAEPAAGRRERCARHAAETKMAARERAHACPLARNLTWPPRLQRAAAFCVPAHPE